jgi:hypothetical protein
MAKGSLEFLSLTSSDVGCSFLAYVDLLGTTYSASTLATGYGAYLAQPILRKEVEGRESELTEEEATRIMETCMRVLYYRDARSIDKVRFCTKYKAPSHSLNLWLFFSSTKLPPSLLMESRYPILAIFPRHGLLPKALEVMALRLSKLDEQRVHYCFFRYSVNDKRLPSRWSAHPSISIRCSARADEDFFQANPPIYHVPPSTHMAQISN